jgi:hypothetical protein
MSMAAVVADFGRSHRGSGSIFFEDIEKLHEFGRNSVFTNWLGHTAGKYSFFTHFRRI